MTRTVLVLATCVLWARPVWAADRTPATCIAASESALSLRKSGKLLDARARLVECSATDCPGEVRAECEKQLDQVKAAIPTIVFEARDASGQDLAAVTVEADARRVAERLDGAALEMDPGEHRFRFTTPGQPTVERAFVLRQGEKGRRERVLFAAEAPPPPATPAGPAPPPPQAPSFWSAPRVVGVVVAGVGLGGVTVGSVFGLQAASYSSDQKKACPSTASCTPSQHADATTDHSRAATDATVSTVAFAGGGVALAAAAVLWAVAPSGARTEGGAAVTAAPAIGPGVAGLTLGGKF